MEGMGRHPQPIGMRIKRARERLRWTQAQLGSAIGVTQKTIDNWEHDKTYPKSAIGALEEVLGLSLDGTQAAGPELVPGDEWEAQVLGDPDLPAEWKRELIESSRAARAAYRARKAERAAALRRAGRAG